MAGGMDRDPASARRGRADPRVLRRLLGYAAPYRLQVAGAVLALSAASAAVLAFGSGLRWMVDHGFATGTRDRLDEALLAMLGIVALLAAATAARAHLVAWIGERVAADYNLVSEIRRFEIDAQTRRALVEISVRIVRERGGSVVAGKIFEASAPVETIEGPGAVAALDEAMGRALRDIAAWSAAPR